MPSTKSSSSLFPDEVGSTHELSSLFDFASLSLGVSQQPLNLLNPPSGSNSADFAGQGFFHPKPEASVADLLRGDHFFWESTAGSKN